METAAGVGGSSEGHSLHRNPEKSKNGQNQPCLRFIETENDESQ